MFGKLPCAIDEAFEKLMLNSSLEERIALVEDLSAGPHVGVLFCEKLSAYLPKLPKYPLTKFNEIYFYRAMQYVIGPLMSAHMQNYYAQQSDPGSQHEDSIKYHLGIFKNRDPLFQIEDLKRWKEKSQEDGFARQMYLAMLEHMVFVNA
jgi:hypothetical protein